jgi:glutathione S-transferase
MPCLVHDGEAYTDSHEIATYLDYFFPEPALKDPAKDPQSKAAFEAASGLFPALAKCIKNLDKAEDEKLVNGVMAELKKIDAHLGSSGGDYLGGASIGLVDCSVAPKLYHAKGTLAHFKNAVIDPDFENLHRYMTTMFSHPAFKASQYPVDVAIWGWNNARGTSAA